MNTQSATRTPPPHPCAEPAQAAAARVEAGYGLAQQAPSRGFEALTEELVSGRGLAELVL